MSWIDWVIVATPLIVVVWIGMKSRKYVKGVADFLAAGRCARRYVLAVAGGEAAWGLITVVADAERDYQCGFAFGFWNKINIPLALIFALSGYCVYRFRETKALTMGQFLEMRYSRSFRIFAAILQATSGIINYAIFPAVGARFLIYFLGLPAQLHIGGMTIPTAGVLMFCFLAIALGIILVGGQVTIMVTDCIQGILSYPMYVIIVAFILWKFSWFNEMAPVLSNRVPGESFMNPYDISKLRDFNLVFVIIGIFSTFLNRMSWTSAMGYNAAAINAHEEKIGGLLGTWRSGLSTMMFTLLAVASLTFMNHKHFANEAHSVRSQLAHKVTEDVMSGQNYVQVRDVLHRKIDNIPVSTRTTPLSQQDNLDTPYKVAAQEAVGQTPGGGMAAQNFRTIYGQMLVPLALREMFPIGITGVFCALMIFLMISTDTTYMHSWGSVIQQDIILPMKKEPMTPEKHLRMLRICIAGVCVFSFFFSLFFAQMDYIMMFFAITGAIWTGGAGPVIVFGLYSKRGNAAGAFGALLAGSGISVAGFIAQQLWSGHIYPWCALHGWVAPLDTFLRAITKPFGSFVTWSMTPDRFPINSVEISFIAMLTAVVFYVVLSALTSGRKTFNLEKLLHRGVYAGEGEGGYIREKWSFKNVFSKIIGITNEYSKGDKILAWSVFIYSFVYCFGLCFLAVVIWNAISKWTVEGWSWYFLITSLIVVGIIGVVTTVWFTIGGIRDLRRLFQDLSKQKIDASDDGTVTKE